MTTASPTPRRRSKLGHDPVSERQLIEHRRLASEVSVPERGIVGSMKRSRIPKAKLPFPDAVKRVLRERHEFLPLSDRQIHLMWIWRFWWLSFRG